MATTTFGPIGALYRGRVRQMALELGLDLTENKGLVSSTFRASGAEHPVKVLTVALRQMVENLAAADHRDYVVDMERAEKSRVKWGRLIGRKPRTTPFTREESQRIFDLICEAQYHAGEMQEDAETRLTKSSRELARMLDASTSDETISTMADVYLRYLQHDVRRGDIRLDKALRRRILAVKPNYDTWGD